MKVGTFPRVSDSTQQRREHIVQAAAAVIAQGGLPALSFRAVASEAGCSRGLVEHYFRNKTTLLVAVNAWTTEAYMERVDAEVGAMVGLEALELRLRNLLPYNEALHAECKVRIAFWHQGMTMPTVEEGNNQSFYVVYKAILADMRAAQESGDIAAIIPVVVSSELLLMTVTGLCVLCMGDAKLRQKTPLDRRIEMLLAFLKTGDAASLEVGNSVTDY